MNDENGHRRTRGRRALSGEDHALWEGVTRSVKPLKRRRAPSVKPKPAEAPPPAVSEHKKPPSRPAPVLTPLPKAKPSAPPLAPLERRLKQKVARGSAPIDARIDLHGMTQERAHAALLRFLRKQQGEGARLVLVITGKGARASVATQEGERGVLRRAVPHWLALPEFRAYVIGFEAAHIGHGGEGALYVRVRRAG
jgi:DNA-nicking Smr family endonuclease